MPMHMKGQRSDGLRQLVRARATAPDPEPGAAYPKPLDAKQPDQQADEQVPYSQRNPVAE
jgi:hypothetical protein